MPNIVVALSDLESSVERPVVLEIIRQLMDITEISSKTPIRFYGEEGKAAQQGTTVTPDGVGENRWGFDEKITIEVDEDFERDRILATAIKQPENMFIFNDPLLRTYIKPVYSPTEVTVTFKYRAVDHNQAKRWRNEIRTRTAMLRDVNLHEASYHYNLPEELFILVQEIHAKREAIAGYNQPFDDYFTTHLTNKASIVTNLAGNRSIWAISERQIRVQGLFDFPGVPDKPVKEGDQDTFTATFEYRFFYDKPIHANMRYPAIIHQQLLDAKYLPQEKPYSITDQLKTYSLSAKNFSKFEGDRAMYEMESNRGVVIPSFDDFQPNSIVPSTLRVITALSTITDADKRTLFNLKDLGEFSFDQSILDFITATEYPFMGKTYQSIFCLNLYENEFLKGSDSLEIGADLTIRAKADLSLRKPYRTRLSLVADFSYLSNAAKARLRANSPVALRLVIAINAALTSLGGHGDLKKNRLSDRDLNEIGLQYGPDGLPKARDPNNYDSLPLRPGGTGSDIRMNLVQCLFVASRPMKDYAADRNNQTYGPTS